MMLEHHHPDCTGRWIPGPRKRTAPWPRHFRCDRCGSVHDNGPGVYQAAEEENDLSDYLIALRRGDA
jgi:hypothetical protein